MTKASEKKTLRAEARTRRAACVRTVPDHAMRLAGHVDALALQRGIIVGGYMALAGEADPSVLVARLVARGHPIAMPRVTGRHAPLTFHFVKQDAVLAPGAYGILEPDLALPQAVPAILLVPLLAFDASGRRLGYGCGYYDRTLAALRAVGSAVAIGVAYAGQEVAALPTDPFDQPLDMVLTEDGLRDFIH